MRTKGNTTRNLLTNFTSTSEIYFIGLFVLSGTTELLCFRKLCPTAFRAPNEFRLFRGALRLFIHSTFRFVEFVKTYYLNDFQWICSNCGNSTKREMTKMRRKRVDLCAVLFFEKFRFSFVASDGQHSEYRMVRLHGNGKCKFFGACQF
jgi:hypothetical protein